RWRPSQLLHMRLNSAGKQADQPKRQNQRLLNFHSHHLKAETHVIRGDHYYIGRTRLFRRPPVSASITVANHLLPLKIPVSDTSITSYGFRKMSGVSFFFIAA